MELSVARITVPEALDAQRAHSLADAIERACAETPERPAARVIVLEGRPGSFCRGMDLESLVATPDVDAPEGTPPDG